MRNSGPWADGGLGDRPIRVLPTLLPIPQPQALHTAPGQRGETLVVIPPPSAFSPQQWMWSSNRSGHLAGSGDTWNPRKPVLTVPGVTHTSRQGAHSWATPTARPFFLGTELSLIFSPCLSPPGPRFCTVGPHSQVWLCFPQKILQGPRGLLGLLSWLSLCVQRALQELSGLAFRIFAHSDSRPSTILPGLWSQALGPRS